MSARNWEKELAKIDKQMSSLSDQQLLSQTSTADAPPGGRAPRAADAGEGPPPSRAGVLFRVGLAVALAVGVHFWPYSARCGLGLAGYLATLAVVIAAGAWAATSTWRGRMGRAHLLALLVAVWGISLSAVEVLPRIGYAKDPVRVHWACP